MPAQFVPELLSPAGSLRNMRYAFAYGADAVYAGQPRYSLRVRNNEFNAENLAVGIREAHELGKKFYVVSNIAPPASLSIAEPIQDVVMLEEKEKPGVYMPAFEDEHGTYIMNSKDLRAVQHVHRLTKMGVHSLKIEGRTKSHYYCARAAQVYRKAIDDAVAGKPFDPSLMSTLESLAHRGYTEGFLRRHSHSEYQNYETGSSISEQQQFVGEVISHCADQQTPDTDMATVEVKNKFCVGDTLELMTPSGNISFTLQTMLDKQGKSIKDAKGSGHQVRIPVPKNLNLQYALVLRYLEAGSNTRKPYSQYVITEAQ